MKLRTSHRAVQPDISGNRSGSGQQTNRILLVLVTATLACPGVSEYPIVIVTWTPFLNFYYLFFKTFKHIQNLAFLGLPKFNLSTPFCKVMSKQEKHICP